MPSGQLRAALVAVLVLLLIGFVSLVWTPYPVDQGDISSQLQNAGPEHLLGTDARGRDTLSLVMKGMLTSFVAAAIAVAVGLLAGVPLGLLAAASDRWVRWTISGILSFLATPPALVAAATLAAVLGPGPINVMLAVGVALISVFAVTTREAARMLMPSGYFDAARVAGLGSWEAATRHVFPQLSEVLAAQALTQLGFAVIAEAALSYLAFGAQPGGISLGLMLRDAQSHMLFAPLQVIVPGLAVALIAGAAHLAGDSIQRGVENPLRTAGRDHVVA